jgi:hypothetical protein
MTMPPTPKSYGLGRLYRPDERNNNFPMRKLLQPSKAVEPRPRSRTHRIYWVGQQGAHPHCVGFAWTGFLRATPYSHTHLMPSEVYAGAQKDDEWAGENYDGSSVLGGARYLSRLTIADGPLSPDIGPYHWAKTVDEVLDCIGLRSPVVLGTDWHTDMFKPNSRGVINATGALEGGHAYLAIGYDDRKGLVKIVNSWGKGWGIAGRAFLSYDDLAKLLEHQGEACVAEKINFGRVGHVAGTREVPSKEKEV